MYDNDGALVVDSMYSILSGMSWNANSSMEKSQNDIDVGGQ